MTTGVKRKRSTTPGRPTTTVTSTATATATSPEPRLICVYNFKGGVGKTTTCISLASTIVNSKREDGSFENVLLVDFDQQCNLTSFLLDADPDKKVGNTMTVCEEEVLDLEKSQRAEAFWKPLITNNSGNWERAVTSALVKKSVPPGPPWKGSEKLYLVGNHNDSVYDYLYELFIRDDIDAFNKYLNHPQPPVTCRDDVEEPPGGRTAGIRYVVPGDPRIVFLESSFSKIFASGSNLYLSDLRKFTSIRVALTTVARKNNCGYVIVDLGPSAGALNKTVALNCDVIVPPIFADRFSKASVEGLLTTVLPTWLKSFPVIKTAFEQAERGSFPYDFSALKNPPLLAPFLMSKYGTQKGKDLLDEVSSFWLNETVRFLTAFSEKKPRNGKSAEDATVIADRSMAAEERKKDEAAIAGMNQNDRKVVVGSFSAPPGSMVVAFAPALDKAFGYGHTHRKAMIDLKVDKPVVPASATPAEKEASNKDYEYRRWQISHLQERFRDLFSFLKGLTDKV